MGLKKLVTACYRNRQSEMFSRHDSERAIWLEYNGNRKGGRVPDVKDIGEHPLEGDGDFCKAETIELLKRADIVVTNPPFSLFREYVAQLVEHGKKFLIIGGQNAITYKEIFPLIKDNRMWLGYGFKNGNAYFKPSDHKPYASKSYFDKTTGLVKFRNVKWFTNLDHAKRHEKLRLYKRYSPEEYPAYDNYDAIEVGKIKDIPVDWDGAMGVPITFLDNHNQDEFEIIWTTDRGGDGMLEDMKLPHSRYDAPVVNGKGLYKRILIRNKAL
ncbi:MAG: adenosine deaminase [Bryobacterales bacterium]|nr:adenosine deaminase [Bryobacterales bacterium]